MNCGRTIIRIFLTVFLVTQSLIRNQLDLTTLCWYIMMPIASAILHLPNRKVGGSNGLVGEHLKCSPQRLSHLIAMCFSAFFVYGHLPLKMIETILVPLIKDKAGDLCDKSNYCPVGLCSVLSKILEAITLKRIENCLHTTANQFGLKNISQLKCVFLF